MRLWLCRASPFIMAFSSDASGSGLLLPGRVETMVIQQGDNRLPGQTCLFSV